MGAQFARRAITLAILLVIALFLMQAEAIAAPGNVTLNVPSGATAHSLLLSWTQSADTIFKEYRLYRSLTTPVTQSSQLIASITSKSTISYKDSLLRAGTKYYYKVFVVDTLGGISTGSNEVNGTTVPNTFPFADDMEGNTELNYTAEGLWGLTTTAANSPGKSWTDSPVGNYANTVDASLNLPINLSNATMPILTFWTRFGTEPNGDFGRVEVSIGTGWTVAGYWTGSQTAWKKVTLDLTQWAGSSNVTVRFRFTTNGNATVSDGWYIDDVMIAETTNPTLGYPFYEAFDDSTYITRWNMAQWQVVTDGRSVPGRVHDSPQGNYLQSGGTGASDDPNSFTSLTTAGTIDLISAIEPVLTFWQKYDLKYYNGSYHYETDAGRVYISTNNGLPGTWVQIYSVSNAGQTASWQRVEVDLSPYVGNSSVRFRFVVDDQRDQDPNTYGDQSESGDGWWIDDIRIENRPAKVTMNAPANVSMHGVTLSWTQNTDTDFQRYEIYRNTSTAIDRSSQLIATITDKATTSYYDVSQVLQPTNYSYRVYVLDTLETVSTGSTIVTASYSVPTVTFPFADSVDVAADTTKWAWSSPWGRTNSKSHSGSFSWTDSPNSSYSPNSNTALSTNINLSSSTSPVLTFWHQYSLETNVDYGYVEISTNGGSSWAAIHTVTGIDTSWKQVRIDLSAYIGSTIGLRFRLMSSASMHLDGWYIDDIVLNDGIRIVGYPFTEDFEQGFNRWFVENPWGLTQDNPHGGNNAMTDSPSGTYADNSDTELLMHINLALAQMPVLKFWTRFSTEVNVDYGRVEVNIGSGWIVAGYWTGTQSTWKQISVDLTPWAGSSDVQIRWRLTSNGSMFSDGWYIDDISIAESSMPTMSYPFIESFDDSTSRGRWYFSQWEIVTDGRSVPGRVHDSPMGNYLQSGGSGASDEPNSFTSLTTSGLIDLSTAVDPILSFWQKYDLKYYNGNYHFETDAGRVYISSNRGAPGSWAQLYSVTNAGQTGSWQRVDVDLSAYVGQSNVRLRFIMDDQRDQDPNTYGDQSESGDGWWIDDIRIENRPTKITLAPPSHVSMHGASLSWNKNNDGDFRRYELYRYTTNAVDRSSQLIATISNAEQITFTDTYSAIHPTHYFYRIYVLDTLGTVSLGSNVVEATYAIPTVTFPFVNDVETAADTVKWAWGDPWGRTSVRVHSGSYSWTDSPNSNYPPNANAVMMNFVSLSGSTSPVLTFWHSYMLEEGYDYGYVEVSTDNGSTWQAIHAVTGIDTAWNQERIDLSVYTGSTIGFRFRLTSNASNQLDGWYIDDIRIENGALIAAYPFSDNVESGNPIWFMDSPWSMTNIDAHGGQMSWTDSPAGSYTNNTDNSLKLHINLSLAKMPVLTFWTRYATEVNVDYCRVEVNSGTGWTIAGYWSGSQSTWRQIRVDLSQWAGSSDVLIRWRLTSNSGGVSDGWYIDDIEIKETTIPKLVYPFLDSFDDSTTYSKWNTSQWDIVTGGRSPQGTIHDSPTGNYLQSGGTGASDNPNSFAALVSANVIDLSRAVNPILTFWQKYDLKFYNGNYHFEADYGRVYVSANYGLPGTWTQLYSVTNAGQTSTWQQVSISLSVYAGLPNVRLMFVVDDQRDQDPNTYGDQSESGGGWWIDDLRIGENISATAVVDSAIVESPAQTTSTPAQPIERIYGLVYEPAKTTVAGQGAGILAQLGLGPHGSYPNDTTWSWINATYLNDAGGSDRYFGSLTAPSIGTYSYTFRFSADGGTTWIYADLNGNYEGTNSSNGFSPEKTGTLVVSNRPDMQLSLDSILVYLPVGSLQNWSFYLGNGGADAQGPLGFNILESTDGTNPAEIIWYGINIRSGSILPKNRSVIMLTFDATGLKTDTTYRAYLVINSNDPNRSKVSVPVILRTVASSTTLLRGVVTDLQDQRISNFARVEVFQNGSLVTSVTSDANGNFIIYGLSNGIYDLRVVSEAFFPKLLPSISVPISPVTIRLSNIPKHFPTNKSINAYSTSAMFGGSGVRPGDVITVADPSGVFCGVFMVHTAGQYGFMHVYGDDATTPTVDEGAVAGDTLKFFINEYPAQTLGPDAPRWMSENAVIQVALAAQNLDIIPLVLNWNLISFTSVPPNDSIKAVLNSIDGKYSLVSSFDLSWGGARTYDPALPQFSDLSKMDAQNGYWIKLTQADTLRIPGERINTDLPLALEQGWNLIPYVPEIALPVATALSSIAGKYSIVSGFENGAKTFVPGSPFNDLAAMKNGLGYWVKTSQPVVMNYAGGTMGAQKMDELLLTTSLVSNPVQATPLWTDYYGSFTIGGKPVPRGETVEAFDNNGIKCGEVVVKTDGIYGFLHVYGDDPNTPGIDEGARPGDVITLKYRSQIIAQMELKELRWNGDHTSRRFDVSIAQLGESNSLLPTTYDLLQNYPNPFNPTTRIRYQMPEDGIVTVKIFDVLGREVRSLVNEQQKAGFYSLEWDGKNSYGLDVSAGTYFCRMQSGQFSKSMKMVFVK
ncbi:MAG: choice-of-anchor J domain-containing protein [bacterium]